MNSHTFIHAMFGAVLLSASLTACKSDGDGSTSDASATDPTATGTGTNPIMGGTDPTTGGTDGTTDPGTGTNPTSSTTDPTTGGDNGFVFADDPYEAYTQIDRHGAVEAGTAGIRAKEGLGFNDGSDISIRDDYNASNPVEDIAQKWVPEIGASVTFFHDAFDDDLMTFGLVPATVAETVMQAGPVIIPDTIKYDPSMPTSYPNGRKLEDPVVDITLAAVLLKLGGNQPLTTFADLPLNPTANDVPFKDEFPFLAPPHAP